MSLKDIVARQEAGAEERKPAPYKQLLLADGDIAKIRFISDDEFDTIYIHRKNVKYPSGKGFTYNIPCKGDVCDYCESPDSAVSKKHNVILAWLFVDEIYHATASRDSNIKWDAIKRKGTGGTVYMEKVNSVMLWLNSVGQKGALKNQLVEMYNENGTITDRYFTWSRKGKGQFDTTYTLTPKDKDTSPFDIKVKPPITLDAVQKYLLDNAASNESYKSKNNGISAKSVETAAEEAVESNDDSLDALFVKDDSVGSKESPF